MNDYYSDLLLSILNNINNKSVFRNTLLSEVQQELGEELTDSDILPVLEKCIEKNVIKTLSNDILAITDIGLTLLIDPNTAYKNLWLLPSQNRSQNDNNSNDNHYEKLHINSLNNLNEAYNMYIINLKKYLKHLLQEMDNYDFEEFVINTLIKCGEAPLGETTKKSHDGGIDGFLYKTRFKQGIIPVQAKCYSDTNLVSEQEIRDFIGSMHQSHKYGSYFVTTSTFTTKAIDKAKEHGIILIDGIQLIDLVIEYKIGLTSKYGIDFLLTPILSEFK
ncbi:restriction endonuclease [Clostridium polynesiense]|uniref:restriction endonuclease n=1 Tax=Clostridium polynesiense TaxID=1325933 RepID=UPI000694035B|nr:restriction endonuclease [Clostridium polynesiense]